MVTKVEHAFIFDNAGSEAAKAMQALLMSEGYTVSIGGYEQMKQLFRQKDIDNFPKPILVCAPDDLGATVENRSVDWLVKLQRAERVIPIVLYPPDHLRPDAANHEKLTPWFFEDHPNVRPMEKLDRASFLKAYNVAFPNATERTRKIRPVESHISL